MDQKVLHPIVGSVAKCAISRRLLQVMAQTYSTKGAAVHINISDRIQLCRLTAVGAREKDLLSSVNQLGMTKCSHK